MTGGEQVVTKEQIYTQQMKDLGIYEEIFDPEIRTLCRIERELTRAQKAWAATAPPGGKPSFLDDHFPIIQKLRAEILQHREALGLTPKALRKLTGAVSNDAPMQKDLIAAKLDQIAASVAGYDAAEIQITQDAYETLPEDMEDIVEQAFEVAAEFDAIDEELRQAVAEDMG